MLCSDIYGHKAFKLLCKILNDDLGLEKVLETITLPGMRDFLAKALELDPEKRATLQELKTHIFFRSSEYDNQDVKHTNKLSSLILTRMSELPPKQASKVATTPPVSSEMLFPD